ncbi:GNAT family N-acetyltransferase, partial [Vibrio cholerae]|nr:GNAT family N-acetyltransferase [Vibrio cholerae]
MNLEEFQESDFDLLIKWIDSDELNYLWGCLRMFPVDL